jgi:glucose-6-phosphate dehydrogenase assembly protein OpcA
MATKVVIDSAAAADGTEAIRRMADSVRQGGIRSDLAWTRLTRWRETLARVFENRDTLARLSEVDRVQVRFGPGYETAARYLAAWAANALASVGQVVAPAILRQDESLRLELSGGQFRVELSREDERLVTVVNEQTNCTNLPRATDYLLMREELGIVRRDAVFESTLASAARLALSSPSGQS